LDETVWEDLLEAIRGAKTTRELEELRVRILGRRGTLTQALAGLGALPPEERRRRGQALNQVKATLEAALAERLEALRAEEVARRLAAEAVDLSLPGLEWPLGHRHPLTVTAERVEDIFVAMGYETVTGPEVETDYHNFEALNFPPGHPARDMHDTFFVRGGRLLRTHTSPVQIRTMQARAPAPIRVVAPGRVYRRDDDPTHSPVFYQVEGLVVGPDVTLTDLKGTLIQFASAFFGTATEIRLRPSYFPFTEPSAEVDARCPFCAGEGCRVCKGSGWIELAGAGMVHPVVLRNGGYDPGRVSGFAFGMGVDRLTMLAYGIDDLRHLYAGDVRFLSQF
jgi:phenylalanyl-tRNA synthetase alpha chain